MSIVVADIIEGVKWKEEGGRVVSIDRAFIVSGLPVQPLDIPHAGERTTHPGAFQFDEVMKAALADASVAQPGEAHPVHAELFVVERTPKIIGSQTVMVTCTYKLPGGGSFDPPTGTQYMMSGGTSVEQVETPFNRLEQSDGSLAGSEISLQHEGLEDQVGTISPFEGRAVLSFGAAISSLAPWLLVANWVNTVNAGTFFYAPGAVARTWLITDMNFELSDRETVGGLPIYEFQMNMRHNPTGWDPDVWMVDPDTGRPPKDMVSGEGFKKIFWYDERNFNSLFN